MASALEQIIAGYRERERERDVEREEGEYERPGFVVRDEEESELTPNP